MNYEGTTIVLLEKGVTPHSFLKYLFINKGDYTGNLIEPEIISHEQTHIKQLHSIDIILVELLQVIYWINPLIVLYRKAIQLNHEFLADDAVIKKYPDTGAYQHLLLAKAGQSHSLYLTSQFNYYVIKKRLLMMTKNASVKLVLYKQFVLAAIFISSLLLFSCRSIADMPLVALSSRIKADSKSPAINRSANLVVPVIMKKNGNTFGKVSCSSVADTLKSAKTLTTARGNTDTLKKMMEVVLTPPPNYTDFTGKLLLINGKEVPEDTIKKLPVSAIRSITPFNGTDDTGSGGSFNKIYGEKAKNGVIWIVVKPAS